MAFCDKQKENVCLFLGEQRVSSRMPRLIQGGFKQQPSWTQGAQIQNGGQISCAPSCQLYLQKKMLAW